MLSGKCRNGCSQRHHLPAKARQPDGGIEPDCTPRQNEDGFSINSYFIEHPEMILGRQTSESTQYGKQDFTVGFIEGADLAEQSRSGRPYRRTNRRGGAAGAGRRRRNRHIYSRRPKCELQLYRCGRSGYYRENSWMVKPELNATAIERQRYMVELRDCVQKLIGQQMDGLSPTQPFVRPRQSLTICTRYFTAKYGLLNSRGSALAFADDSSYYLLCPLRC